MEHLLFLIPACPLLAFAVLMATGRRMNESVAGLVGSLGPLVSFVLAARLLTGVWVLGTGPVETVVYEWIAVGGLSIPFGLRLDGLSGVLVLLVTGVGSLIHIYSIGYMAGDRRFDRFFAYLNLFSGMMLLLVTADNLVLLFVGWEGVGLCSYLLIGFWSQEMANARAAQKAFVVNRIGDAAFLLGTFLAFRELGTVDLAAINLAAAGAPVGVLTAIGLLLFVGATGKSAQIPLFVWLPDAMAGPTPVSALIHAATMVTSGIYLIARLSGLYAVTPGVGEVIAVVGAATALLAALIAMSQNDIKKVLAYSTVSQLGYMFLAVGLGAYATGVFHLLTHGFFKALLFLGAGSVIHGLAGEQDIGRMGGLRRAMPVTFATFLVGGLALAGVPLLAGFFSKDAILGAALGAFDGRRSPIVLGCYVAGLVTAFLTAIYTFRLIALVFLGAPRGRHHAHESPPSMVVPLIVLALLSAFGGALGVESLGVGNRSAIVAALWPVVADGVRPDHGAHLVNLVLSVAAAIGGTSIGLILYTRRREAVAGWFTSGLGGALYRASLEKFRVDEVYDAAIVRPIGGLARLSLAWIDQRSIDGILHVLGAAATGVGDGFRQLATGRLRSYATLMVVGVLVVLTVLLLHVYGRTG